MKMLAFDTETTGLDPQYNDVVEFGGCIYDENKNIIKEFSSLIKTNMKMSSEVIAIHGITHQMLNDKGEWFKDISQEIYDFMDSADVYVGHNLPFDLKFMNAMFSRHGMNMPVKPTVDTIQIAYRYVPQSMSKRSLSALCKWAQVPLENAHRALDDAKASINLMFILSEKLSLSIEELVDSETSPALGCLHWGSDPFLSQFSGNRVAYEEFND